MSTVPTAPAAPSAPPAAPKPVPRRMPLRRIIYGLLAFAGIGLGLYVGIPLVDLALNTVSTDDAYVNGHVTFVAVARGGAGC